MEPRCCGGRRGPGGRGGHRPIVHAVHPVHTVHASRRISAAVASIALACCAIPGGTARAPVPGGPVLPPVSDSPGPEDTTAGVRLGDAALERLSERMDRAHASLGHARPAVTQMVTGDLGTGQTQGFDTELERGACYTFIVACATDDQRVDLTLYDESAGEVAQSLATRSTTAVDVCPPARGRYRVVVRMYAGSGPFALRVFGS